MTETTTVEVDGTEVEVRETEDGFEAEEVTPDPVDVVRESARAHDGHGATFTNVEGKGDSSFDVAVRLSTPNNVKSAESVDEYVGGDVQYVRAVDSGDVYDGIPVYDGPPGYGIEAPERDSSGEDVIFFVDSGV